MSTTKTLTRTLKIFFLILLLIVAIQLLYSISIIKSRPTVEKSDLIVVFPGHGDRFAPAHYLASEGLANSFMLIGATPQQLSGKIQTLGDLDGLTLIGGGKSRSTFEDVYMTAKIIKEKDIQSLTLVTSSYHMPRALYLLRSFLLFKGENVRIQYYPAPIKNIESSAKILALYYNEMLKMWGSTIEMAGNLLTGKLLYDIPILQQVSNVAHKYLLIDV